MSDERANSRLPITPANHERMKEFKNGLGSDFDQAIRLLLSLAVKPGEDEYSAGKRLKSTLRKLQE